MSMIDNVSHKFYVIGINNRQGKSMHVSLTPELEKQVKSHVDSGLYNSSSEVVREALRLWLEQQQYKKKMEVLRARLELAELTPLVDDFSIDELIKELDRQAP
jgi:putative addiction module CopG family antidote